MQMRNEIRLTSIIFLKWHFWVLRVHLNFTNNKDFFQEECFPLNLRIILNVNMNGNVKQNFKKRFAIATFTFYITYHWCANIAYIMQKHAVKINYMYVEK